MESAFGRDKLLELEYTKCMTEYLELNHMELARSTEMENIMLNQNNQVCYKTNYLPHHGVLKESTTTKLRVVFDASHSGLKSPKPGQKYQNESLYLATFFTWVRYSGPPGVFQGPWQEADVRNLFCIPFGKWASNTLHAARSLRAKTRVTFLRVYCSTFTRFLLCKMDSSPESKYNYTVLLKWT